MVSTKNTVVKLLQAASSIPVLSVSMNNGVDMVAGGGTEEFGELRVQSAPRSETPNLIVKFPYSTRYN